MITKMNSTPFTLSQFGHDDLDRLQESDHILPRYFNGRTWDWSAPKFLEHCAQHSTIPSVFYTSYILVIAFVIPNFLYGDITFSNCSGAVRLDTSYAVYNACLRYTSTIYSIQKIAHISHVNFPFFFVGFVGLLQLPSSQSYHSPISNPSTSFMILFLYLRTEPKISLTFYTHLSPYEMNRSFCVLAHASFHFQ